MSFTIGTGCLYEKNVIETDSISYKETTSKDYYRYLIEYADLVVNTANADLRLYEDTRDFFEIIKISGWEGYLSNKKSYEPNLLGIILSGDEKNYRIKEAKMEKTAIEILGCFYGKPRCFGV